MEQNSNRRKKGLILEGGAMRGMFTCGVLDVLMENGITMDGVIGVSAGAVFGCNYKSHQIGRPIRYNKKYCNNKEYCSWSSWLRTGDLYGEEFCYRKLPMELDPMDFKTFDENPMDFFVVCTDIESGRPVYRKIHNSRKEMSWFQATASMPVVSRPVKIGKRKLLDGGIADSIPVKKMESLGYSRNVLVATQPEEYRKKRNKLLPLVRVMTWKYPAVAKTLAKRHLRYNKTVEYCLKEEAAGRLFIIRPPEPLEIGSTEKNPRELERVYRIGRKVMEEKLEDLRKYLDQPDTPMV